MRFLSAVFFLCVLSAFLLSCDSSRDVAGEYWYSNSRLELMVDGRFTLVTDSELIEGKFSVRDNKVILTYNLYGAGEQTDIFIRVNDSLEVKETYLFSDIDIFQ